MDIAKQATLAPSRETVNVALLLILEVALMLGVLALPLWAAQVLTGSAGGAVAAAAFDAAAFRIGEHSSISAAPALRFDAAAFRQAERSDLGARVRVPFDRTAFRIGERAATSEVMEQAAFRLSEHVGR